MYSAGPVPRAYLIIIHRLGQNLLILFINKQFLEYSQAKFVDSISSPYIFSLIIGSYNKSYWICSVYLYTLKIFKFLKFTKNENIRKVFKYF